MDVGADEFEQSLPLLQELVLGADFVGLDIEFTGLRSNLSRPQQISLFDLPSEWYLKTRQSVQQFTICQIGLSVFSSIEGESNKYVAHSCNFFLFPTTFGILDSEFSFQASSVQFLNQYGFDYNKFLKNGIPYMNEEQEKKIKHNILTGNWSVHSSPDKDQIKVVIDEVTRWLDLAAEGDWMTLPGIAGFQAFEVQLVLRQALPDIWTVLRDQGVVVKKVSKQHRWYLENTSGDRESCWKEKILLSARGFSVFFQMLVKAQKPLVGHNMMMDLLHLHEKFFRPLPESYEQFKLNVHNLFPVLIDTKNVTKDIWKELNFPRVSNLSEVYEVLNSDLNPSKNSGPVIIHASKCEKYVETKYPHEAAYDAFLCGSVLLKVAHLLLWRVHGASSIPELSFPLYLDVLAPYVNQVNLIRAGVPKINFSGPDYPSIRPPILILRVRRWPGLSEQQVYREFQNLCKFDVRRLTRSQFLLLTNKFKDARTILREYRGHPTLQVSLYRHWRHSPSVNCVLQVCGVVTTWALLAFLLGRPGP
ncbi:poly(A)-specific ribonuclease PNLDC1 [Equus asinus]|uniref:Poly(A)-specific ribonuclease PNLDC1 n=3 Tax=Equus TaxID=9789 RepID=A0A3Q2LR40_HORSE|nr:poly(A)-specific ribonuclease PNLDC1 isoform X1 [Equus caballus]XP_044617301.1 poly(A)-specific ribonuclease PNLDC1 isoform X1 [Equus asinus]XP_046524952.1 poly(A)-specific ribonuclease PNLDC1 [Equus quagga]XP_046524953.1 poly(A)-specific ribonuclease PNLDC1 [Equus quagga]XP_046524954.1 poly(A)-specific ribonuclease PNLDC1 [Equus quagga]